MLSIDDQGPPPTPPARFNLAAHALKAADTTPDKIAISILRLSGAERWSFGRLRSTVEAAALALCTEGVASGDRVALRLANTIDLPLAFLATSWAGAVPILIPEPWTTREIENAVFPLSPRLFLKDHSLSLPETETRTLSMTDLRGTQEKTGPAAQTGDPNRPGYIVFTSGSEGRAKPVLHAHRAIYARTMMTEGWYGLKASDRVLHPGAFNWTYTLGTGLLDPWASGATALIPASGTDPTALPLLLRRHEATLFAGAPAHYRRLLKTGAPLDLPALRHGLSAGEKLSTTIRTAWRHATGTEIYEAFGMTECSTFISANPARQAPEGTVGYVQSGRRIAVLDSMGAPQPRGTEGRLAIDATDPGLMLGYAGEKPAAQTGWHLTSDTVRMEADGAVTYLGRADDMMNAGGVRVSPLEVEAALRTAPGVQDAVVAEVPVKDETRIIAAFCLCTTALDEAAIRAHMSDRLAAYKCPRAYIRVDALPRTANGKLNRRALRDGWKVPE